MKKQFNPEITRVKLTQEQAVLTCCFGAGKADTTISAQCRWNNSCGGVGVWDALSS